MIPVYHVTLTYNYEGPEHRVDEIIELLKHRLHTDNVDYTVGVRFHEYGEPFSHVFATVTAQLDLRTPNKAVALRQSTIDIPDPLILTDRKITRT